MSSTSAPRVSIRRRSHCQWHCHHDALGGDAVDTGIKRSGGIAAGLQAGFHCEATLGVVEGGAQAGAEAGAERADANLAPGEFVLIAGSDGQALADDAADCAADCCAQTTSQCCCSCRKDCCRRSRGERGALDGAKSDCRRPRRKYRHNDDDDNEYDQANPPQPPLSSCGGGSGNVGVVSPTIAPG